MKASVKELLTRYRVFVGPPAPDVDCAPCLVCFELARHALHLQDDWLDGVVLREHLCRSCAVGVMHHSRLRRAITLRMLDMRAEADSQCPPPASPRKPVMTVRPVFYG